MGIKLVNPGEASIEPVEQKLPVLPREEAHRIRRASRSYFDTLLPEAIRVVQDALLSDKMQDRQWAADKVFKATLSNIPNEVSDPETVTVYGTVTAKDDLAALEEMTKDGTGAPDPDGE